MLGALDDRLVIGSMNRAGLPGSVFEVDDRFTAYNASALATANLDGGKMLLRIDQATGPRQGRSRLAPPPSPTWPGTGSPP